MVPDSDSALLPIQIQQNFGRYLQALPAAAQLGWFYTGGGLPSGSLVKKKKKFFHVSRSSSRVCLPFWCRWDGIVSVEEGLWKHSLVSELFPHGLWPARVVAGPSLGDSCDSGAAAAPGLGWLSLGAPGTVTQHPDLFC